MMNTIKEEQHGIMGPTAMDQMPSDLTLTPASSTSPSDEHIKGSESPSPSASGKTPSSASRRPPRKSTLTQQQKNQKRQRATQDQLTTLEMEFSKNPTPTATVRERIADEINMTERSVQIWFQNRRAKIKLLAKKSLETGEDIDSIPESMRAYLAMQAMESGKGLGGAFLGRTGLIPYGSSMMLGGDQSGQGKVLIHHLTCRSLSIGKWTRVGQNTMDLIIFYSPEKCTMTYYINNDQAGYKIEYHFSHIKSITLDSNEGDANKLGGIVIELNRPPNFFMDSSPNSNGFFQCGDFTEDQQATQCYTHHLGGNPKVLSSQLAKLVSLESFMNRHNPNAFYDQGHAMGVASAPVSPTGNRPSSQPNFGQGHVGMFQESQWGISPPHPMRAGPGHKRQRSRSVPMPVDFSMFQNPMPSFYIQHPGESQGHPHNPNIFAPVPQQPQQQLSPVGPNLRIDTQAGFGMDLRPYPLSAATTAPSEYSSPNYFSQEPQHTPLPTSNFNTPYSSTFLSPMVNPAMVPQSVSPLPFNHGDPAIVEQSPPMGMMRSASADLYPMGDSTVSDDGHSLNEMYSKHTINLPMHPHSPGFMDGSQGDLDMNQLVQFDSMDPASMSPEHMPHQQQ
ncbi:homeoprotein [Apiospora marii]|uniref:homeoprotein n=1 Tax=Apiospora marii TaxID=335849 RepID=UPI00312EE459